VRHRTEQREILHRAFVTVETAFGPIRIKLGRTPTGRVLNAAAEFEDCRAAAAQHGASLRDVQMAAMTAYWIQTQKNA
jgi:pyridinium-3,5-bisthiocarboxylic acid mononucleotide nickel chelatase